MKKETSKQAKAIASEFKDFDRRSPVEQMATYFAIGQRLQEVLVAPYKYGWDALKEIIERVPQLRDETHAYKIRDISVQDEAVKKLILEQTAILMSNGQHPTLTHWLWVLRQWTRLNPAEQKAWRVRELEWLRRESPSAAVIEHLENVLEERHSWEMAEAKERVQEAIGLLESLDG